jgi:decaprenylphospho-beta-D-erythro-pentofuranosid-2-ulose 2-reductase
MASVLILGAASDMAVAIARKYASEGYNIQLAARNISRLDSLCSDIRIRSNVSCTAHEFDALDFQSHPAFLSMLPSIPDITICVFGYLGDNETARQQWSETEKIIHTNYTGAVSALNAISLVYAKQQRGTIVGISSVAGERGRQSNYIYGSAKAGFTAYLSGLRNRMFREKVHVLSVQPGFVYTRMTENLALPPLLTAKPEDIANGIFNAVKSGKNVVYIKWFWRYIMLIIRNIPEFIFKKLKL